MSILISDQALIEVIQELAEEKKQSPEEVVAAAIAAYAAQSVENGDSFWESIIGIGNSGDPTFAERDEEILAGSNDPIRGWGSPDETNDSNRH